MEEEESQLTQLLEKTLSMHEADRQLALDNYNMLKRQYESIVALVEMSESGAVEKAMNDSLSLVFKSGERLDKVIQLISKMLMTNMTNDSRERMAKTFSNRTINQPVNIRGLLDDQISEKELGRGE